MQCAVLSFLSEMMLGSFLDGPPVHSAHKFFVASFRPSIMGFRAGHCLVANNLLPGDAKNKFVCPASNCGPL